MTEKSEKFDKEIFVACPISSEGSEERKRSDLLMKHVIFPAVESLGLNENIIVRQDEIGELRRISTQMIKRVSEASVVIADLTKSDPIVMYVVGVRQALLKPMALVAKKGQKIPIELNELRTIFYQLDLEHVSDAKEALKCRLKASLEGSVSELDKAVFSQSDQSSDSASREALMEVFAVCQAINSQTAETKELVKFVRSMLVDQKAQEALFRQQSSKEERVQKDFFNNMQEMQQRLMNQFMQNPDYLNKMMPMMEEFLKMYNPKKDKKDDSDTDEKD